MNPTGHKYCARYCEENIWHLVQEPVFADAECIVAVISNREQACLFWNQRSCGVPDLPVWWDYHVVLLAKQPEWVVYDLDTVLPLPVDAGTYLSQTFREQDSVPATFRPRFVLYEGATFVDGFASDRSHMRDEHGDWLAPPPDWGAINPGRGEAFPEFLARQLDAGTDVSLTEMYTKFGRPHTIGSKRVPWN